MNYQRLMRLLEYSAASYTDEQPSGRNSQTWFYDNKQSGVTYYIRKKQDTLMVVFRGSDCRLDYLTHIQFWKMTVPYSNFSSAIRMHTGFVHAYKSDGVRNIIMSYVDGDVKKITVTGHSYGAALAVLCAVDLQYNFPDKEYEVALFGGPRVGNRAFADSYNHRVFKTMRVTNGNDIVTKLPFKFLGYADVGVDVHVGFPRIFGIYTFESHRLQNYYKNLFRRLST